MFIAQRLQNTVVNYYTEAKFNITNNTVVDAYFTSHKNIFIIFRSYFNVPLHYKQ